MSSATLTLPSPLPTNTATTTRTTPLTCAAAKNSSSTANLWSPITITCKSQAKINLLTNSQQQQQKPQKQQQLTPAIIINSHTAPALAAAGAAAGAAAASSSSSSSATCLHLHAIYPKNKRKYYLNNNKIHKERRKRHNVTNDDGINSYLSLILLVTFTKPLTMWYRFIKSIILTSSTTTTATSSPTTRATQRLFSKGSVKTTSSSSPTYNSKSSLSSTSNTFTSLINLNNKNKTSHNSSSSSCSPALRLKPSKSPSSSPSSSPSKCIRVLPPIATTTSFFTLLTIICLETILLSTMSSCAKTFYMHWNTSNSIFRIDNTDHIIDVNKGNLAFEFDQVHIICPVYEPGTFDNETEKYIIYNVSKVEYETCRITNADPRVIAICDKPQKLMFFTITFRPFTPQPGGLEFLPGNDYYFISTSSKDDLYRRIGGRCSTNNMKVVFKVCCASEEKNKTTTIATGGSSGGSAGSTSTTAVGSALPTDSAGNSGEDITNMHSNQNNQQQQSNHPHHGNNINTIGINGINTGMLPNGVMNTGLGGMGNNQHNGLQLNPIMNSPSGNVATSINTNIDQFNRIPLQPNSINVLSNNIGGGMGMGNMGPPGMSGNNGLGLGSHGGSGILLTPGHNGINMIASGGGAGGLPGIHQYPGHGYHGQTGIRINNVPSTHHTNLKNMQNNNNDNDHHHPYDKHPNEVVKNEELTYNRAASSMTTATALSLIFVLTLALQICYWV